MKILLKLIELFIQIFFCIFKQFILEIKIGILFIIYD